MIKIPTPDTRYPNFLKDTESILYWLPKALTEVSSDSDKIIMTSGIAPGARFTITEGNLKFDARLQHKTTGKVFLLKCAFQNSALKGNASYEKMYKYLPYTEQIKETMGKYGLLILTRENDYMESGNHRRFVSTLHEMFLDEDPLIYLYDTKWESLVNYCVHLAKYFRLKPHRNTGPRSGHII